MSAALIAVACPDCDRVQFERRPGWRGDPVEVICKRCGKRIEVTETATRVIPHRPKAA